ncbi:hypothetical protein G7Y89_g6870 [Cudoniella acicularis]|uniref:GPI inositol-deacylase n=1 Tax=Cudoniella acicularis TaxID=354080 RepID=A0A8H4W2L5_9HELO|nr:hypothetical protein G7Y89_g6870 [Cudoniella acicularis]
MNNQNNTLENQYSDGNSVDPEGETLSEATGSLKIAQALTKPQSRSRPSSKSSNRLGRVAKGAWRKLSPSQGVTEPKSLEHDPSIAKESKDAKGSLGLNLLHDPQDPRIDFIFVHGLGGGSRKTWSLSADPQHYWPKTWLSEDPEFASVRIHSFGYNADWDKRGKSTWNILDFARSLLGDISCNPGIRRSNTNIVLIGHSMGGIVMKKAYMLAREAPELQHLANRINTLYFLATPHRGSDFSTTFSNILSISYGKKPFVNELKPSSKSTEMINDSFRQYAGDLQLWSFYETKPTMLNAVIVEKSSATLGFPNEKSYPLNADHRGVCKFDRQTDPNYKTLRNALVTTVDTISSNDSQIPELQNDQLIQLTDISEPPEDDLLELEEKRTPGSCEWLINREVYKSWQNARSPSQSIFWLAGPAGSGKSFLSSRIINELQQNNQSCSYFFFKHGKSEKSSVVGCLRALAYQMATTDNSILRKLVEVQRNSPWDKWTEHMIWRKVFLGYLFKDYGSKIQFWIIDAVDECEKYQSFLNLLATAPSCLRILFTSRNTPDIEKQVTVMAKNVEHYHLQDEDTIDDFRKFIDSRIGPESTSYGIGNEQLRQRILEKASGSFLWVSLVVKTLEETWSEEAAEEVLNEVPRDMDKFYARMLESVLQNSRAVVLTKSIYMWTLLSLRPLNIDGLQCALKLDTGQTVHNLERFIPAISGQLVSVNQKHEAQIIHQTAKEYLLHQEVYPDLALDIQQCHTRIAYTCLTLIAGKFTEGQVGQQSQALSWVPAAGTPLAISNFTDYACEYFSDHLQQSSSEDDQNWDLLCKFMDCNLLIWIEHLARKHSMRSITRTAKFLGVYYNRQAKFLSSTSLEKAFPETWIRDLLRLSAKFGRNLEISPSSIHTLVPAMCPSQSIFSRYFGSRSPQTILAIRGLTEKTWNDCLARIDYPTQQTTSVACGDQYSAVALSDGTVYVYFQGTTQAKFTLNHGARANILVFCGENRYLVSSGQRKVKIWDLEEGTRLWAFDASHQILTLFFIERENSLIAATQGNYTIHWDLLNGQETRRWQWTETIPKTVIGQRLWPQPNKVIFSPNCEYLAASYRGLPIYVFHVPTQKFLRCFSRENADITGGDINHYVVDALTFNSRPETNILVISYSDGEIVLYGTESAELLYRSTDVFAHYLKCSPDGRTLVTGSSRGTIKIFELAGVRGELLLPLYMIEAHEDGIRDIAISSDSLRFADIRGSQYRMWEPAVLVSIDSDESSRKEMSQAVLMEMKTVSMLEGPPDPEITAMCCTSSGKFVFCGKGDGSVSYFETGAAAQREVLYRHAANCRIACILYVEKMSLLVTADESGRVLINTILAEKTGVEFLKVVTEIRSGEPVSALVHDDSGMKLLLRCKTSVELWTTEGQRIGSRIPFGNDDDNDGRIFAAHPLKPGHFISMGRRNTHIFSWVDGLEVEQSPDGGNGVELANLTITRPTPTQKNFFNIEDISNPYMDKWSPPFLPCLFKRNSSSPSSESTTLRIWPASSIVSSKTSPASIPLLKFANNSHRIKQIIAVAGRTVLFLDIDLWICSLDIATATTISSGARRHFFLLSEWQSIDGSFIVELRLQNQLMTTVKRFLGVVTPLLGFRFRKLSRSLEFESYTMEFYLQPAHPSVPIPKTPYLSTERYDGGPWITYPARKGKLKDTLKDGAFDLLEYSRSERVHPTPLKEQESFFQTWLYFGLIAEFIGANNTDESTVDSSSNEVLNRLYSLVLDKDEKSIRLDMEILDKFLALGRASLPGDLEARKVYYNHLSLCLSYAQAVARNLPREFNHTVRCSISALGELFTTTVSFAFERLGLPGVAREWKTEFIDDEVRDLMVAHGWCPSDVARAEAKYSQIQSLHLARLLDKSLPPRDHSRCTASACNLYQIKNDTYKEEHQRKGCDCEQLTVPEEELTAFLFQKGKFPLILLKGDLDDLTYEIVESGDEPYTAISHVWADGLGNPHANSLHKCKLHHLRALVDAVNASDPATTPSKHAGSLIWLDTLLSPAQNGAGKQSAISKIRLVYQSAKHVLVLDAGLMAYPSRTQEAPEMLARIFTSSWMRRLWTLQEGALAKSLYFQFGDVAHSLNQLTLLVFQRRGEMRYRAVGRDVYNEMLSIMGFFNPISAPGGILALLDKSLQFRSVSVPSDEPLCIGALLGLDLDAILAVPETQEARMQKVWELVAAKHSGIPAQILFFEEERLSTPGFGWAPKSLLNAEHTIFALSTRIIRWGDPKRGQVTPHGLRVSYPGYRIRLITSYGDNKPRNPWPGMPTLPERGLPFRDAETGKWRRIADKRYTRNNRGWRSDAERGAYAEKGLFLLHNVVETGRGVVVLRGGKEVKEGILGVLVDEEGEGAGAGVRGDMAVEGERAGSKEETEGKEQDICADLKVKTALHIIMHDLRHENYIYDATSRLALQLRADPLTDAHLALYEKLTSEQTQTQNLDPENSTPASPSATILVDENAEPRRRPRHRV